MSESWLDRQMLRSAEHLLTLDPLLLGPVARDLLPFAEDVVARERRSKMYVIPPAERGARKCHHEECSMLDHCRWGRPIPPGGSDA